MKECKICGAKFETGKQLGGHIGSKHGKGKGIECEICHRQIKSSGYKKHLLGHKKDGNCLFCGKSVRAKRFCNHSCCASFHNRGNRRHGNPVNSDKKCFNCGITIPLSSKKYCSHDCDNKFKYKNNIERWLRGELKGHNDGKNNSIKDFVRKWLYERANNKCEKCGWAEINKFTGKKPLSVHHKDGNAENTVPVNIELICPNCHSLTETYGALNKGNGRKNRRI